MAWPAGVAIGLATLVGCDPLYEVDAAGEVDPLGGGPADMRPDRGSDAMPVDTPDGIAPDGMASDISSPDGMTPDGIAPAPAIDSDDCPGAPLGAAQADVRPIGPLPALGLDCERLLTWAPLTALDRHPASTPLDGACGPEGHPRSNYTNPPGLTGDKRGYEVHVIAVQRGGLPADDGPSAIEVHVAGTLRPVVLVLASVSEATWRIERSADARIAGVVTVGPGQQPVSGAPVDPQHFDGDHFCAIGDGWEARYHDGDTQHRAMITAIREAFGQHETSYQGCEEGLRFTVPYAACPETEPPAAPPLIPGEAGSAIPGCDDINTESIRCLVSSSEGLDMVGFDTGRTCVIDRRTAYDGAMSHMAWHGQTVWTCSDLGLTRFGLDNLAMYVPEMLCKGILSDGEVLWVLDSGIGAPTLAQRFADAERLLAARPDGQVALEPQLFSAVHDGIFYASRGHDVIERYALASGEALAPLGLVDYDGWIRAFDVVPGFVVGHTGNSLLRFDLETGEQAGEVALPRGRASVNGIVCQGRPTTPSPPAARPFP